MDLRTAATQALEALDNLVDVEVYLREHVVSVAKNLRTALAEQPEPVAWTERDPVLRGRPLERRVRKHGGDRPRTSEGRQDAAP